MDGSMPASRVLRYGIAVAASVAALGLVLGIAPFIGYIPLFFLAAVALVETYAGPGPAIVNIVLCVLGSLFLMQQRGLRYMPNEQVHKLAELGIFPIVGFAVVYLVETRRKHKTLVRKQWLEISTLLESMPEAVFVFDANARIADANPAAQEMCSASRDELVGSHVGILAKHLGAQQEGRPVTTERLVVARALKGERVQNEPRTLSHGRDGSPLDTLLSANPMFDEKGVIIGVLLVVKDITEVTQLQRRVADTERHLAIGQMASGIAHDFNNILNTIAQTSAVLQESPGKSEEERGFYLRMIDTSVQRGAEIIRRVREYVRGGTGESAKVDVRQLLQDALELTRPMWRGVEGLSVVTEFQPVSPVNANAADLRRVFTNLIMNAIQAMPKGGRLTLRCEEAAGRVLASIADSGQGIPPEQQKKIFLPYYTTKATGTGLGLSTAQKILLSQGGNIRFNSDPGRGTTFTVELPSAARPVEPNEARVA
jgi:PAS domain S-box-containing protein